MVVVNLSHQERFRFDIVGIGSYNFFDGSNVFAKSFLEVELGILVISGEAIDPHLFPLGAFVLPFYRLLDEALSPGIIFEICRSHSPVGHCAVGIDGGDLTKASLRFEIPVAVELPDSLIKEFLSLS